MSGNGIGIGTGRNQPGLGMPVQARPDRHGADWQTRSYVRIQNCKPGHPDYGGPNAAGNGEPPRGQAVSIPARHTGRQAERIWSVPTKTAGESFLPILFRIDLRNTVVNRKGQDTVASAKPETSDPFVGYRNGRNGRGQCRPVSISSRSGTSWRRKSSRVIIYRHRE